MRKKPLKKDSVFYLPNSLPKLVGLEFMYFSTKFGIDDLKYHLLLRQNLYIWDMSHYYQSDVLKAFIGDRDIGRREFYEEMQQMVENVLQGTRQMKEVFRKNKSVTGKQASDLIVITITVALDCPELVSTINDFFNLVESKDLSKVNPYERIVSEEEFANIFNSFSEEWENHKIYKILRAEGVTPTFLNMLKTRFIWFVFRLRIAAMRIDIPQERCPLETFFGLTYFKYPSGINRLKTKRYMTIDTLSIGKLQTSYSKFWNLIYMTNPSNHLFDYNSTPIAVKSSIVEELLQFWSETFHLRCVEFYETNHKSWTSTDVRLVRPLCSKLSQYVMQVNDNLNFHVESMIPPVEKWDADPTTNFKYDYSVAVPEIIEKLGPEVRQLERTLSDEDVTALSYTILSFQVEMINDFLKFLYDWSSANNILTLELKPFAEDMMDPRILDEIPTDPHDFNRQCGLNSFSKSMLANRREGSLWVTMMKSENFTLLDLVFSWTNLKRIPTKLRDKLHDWIIEVKNRFMYLLFNGVYDDMFNEQLLTTSEKQEEAKTEDKISSMLQKTKGVLSRILMLTLNDEEWTMCDLAINEMIFTLGSPNCNQLFKNQQFFANFLYYGKKVSAIIDPYLVDAPNPEVISFYIRSSLYRFVFMFAAGAFEAFIDFKVSGQSISYMLYNGSVKTSISQHGGRSSRNTVASDDLRQRIAKDITIYPRKPTAIADSDDIEVVKEVSAPGYNKRRAMDHEDSDEDRFRNKKKKQRVEEPEVLDVSSDSSIEEVVLSDDSIVEVDIDRDVESERGRKDSDRRREERRERNRRREERRRAESPVVLSDDSIMEVAVEKDRGNVRRRGRRDSDRIHEERIEAERRRDERRESESRYYESRRHDSRRSSSRYYESRDSESRHYESRRTESRQSESRPYESRSSESRRSESRRSESRQSESRPYESRSSESIRSESRPSESRRTESRREHGETYTDRLDEYREITRKSRSYEDNRRGSSYGESSRRTDDSDKDRSRKSKDKEKEKKSRKSREKKSKRRRKDRDDDDDSEEDNDAKVAKEPEKKRVERPDDKKKEATRTVVEEEPVKFTMTLTGMSNYMNMDSDDDDRMVDMTNDRRVVEHPIDREGSGSSNNIQKPVIQTSDTSSKNQYGNTCAPEMEEFTERVVTAAEKTNEEQTLVQEAGLEEDYMDIERDEGNDQPIDIEGSGISNNIQQPVTNNEQEDNTWTEETGFTEKVVEGALVQEMMLENDYMDIETDEENGETVHTTNDIVEKVSAVEGHPVVEESVTEEVPVVEAEPRIETETVVKQEPVDEEAAIVEEPMVVNEPMVGEPEAEEPVTMDREIKEEPLDDYESVITQQLMVEHEPTVGVGAVVEEPSAEEHAVEEPQVEESVAINSVVKEEPFEDYEPVVGDEPMVEREPVAETGAMVEESAAEENAVEEPIVEESVAISQVIKEEPLGDYEPLIRDEPMIEHEPIVVAGAVVEEPAAEENAVEESAAVDPAVKQEPLDDYEPMISEEPMVENHPVSEVEAVVQEPEVDPVIEESVAKNPVVKEEPFDDYEPMIVEEPIVENEPMTEVEAVVEEPTVEEPVVEESVAVAPAFKQEPLEDYEPDVTNEPMVENESIVEAEELVEEPTVEPVIEESVAAVVKDEPVDDYTLMLNSVQPTESYLDFCDNEEACVPWLAKDLFAEETVVKEEPIDEQMDEENSIEPLVREDPMAKEPADVGKTIKKEPIEQEVIDESMDEDSSYIDVTTISEHSGDVEGSSRMSMSDHTEGELMKGDQAGSSTVNMVAFSEEKLVQNQMASKQVTKRESTGTSSIKLTRFSEDDLIYNQVMLENYNESLVFTPEFSEALEIVTNSEVDLLQQIDVLNKKVEVMNAMNQI